MFDDLRSKNALVTGAFSGLGRHFALTLARAGCKVALAGRRLADGEKLLAKIRADGGDGCVVAMDVRDRGSVDAAVDAATKALGPIRILVNNAGIGVTRPALDYSEDDWMSVIDTNLNGAWRATQSVARKLRDAGEPGSIINIASILGIRVIRQVPAYVAAKAGMIGLTKALALELARYRIRVNALAPGYIETDLNRHVFETEAGKAMIARIPQRRLGQAAQLDAPLLLLASDASDLMTGSVLTVDGGHLAAAL